MQENSFQVQKGYPIGCCELSQHKQRRKQYDNRIWVYLVCHYVHCILGQCSWESYI